MSYKTPEDQKAKMDQLWRQFRANRLPNPAKLAEMVNRIPALCYRIYIWFLKEPKLQTAELAFALLQGPGVYCYRLPRKSLLRLADRLLKMPGCTPDHLLWLIQHDVQQVNAMIKLANHPDSTPEHFVAALTQDSVESGLPLVAANCLIDNESTTIEHLKSAVRTLAYEAKKKIALALLKRPDATAEDLRPLRNIQDEEIRTRYQNHPLVQEEDIVKAMEGVFTVYYSKRD